MKNIKMNAATFCMTLIGIMATTLGHYAEFWSIGYVVSILAGLVASMIFAGDGI